MREFAAENAGVLGFEDGIVGIGVELVGEVNIIIHVLKADGGESGDQFAQGFHTVGFHVIQDGRGDVAVDHTSELNSSFGDDGVLDTVKASPACRTKGVCDGESLEAIRNAAGAACEATKTHTDNQCIGKILKNNWEMTY